MQNDSRNTKLLLWANRAIRWGFGILFITIGILNNDESRLYALIFGVAFIIHMEI